MTPTEQDKKIIRGIEKALEKSFSYQVLVLNKECRDELIQLITADRERVALEARVDQTFKVIQSLVKGGSISDSSASRALTLFDIQLKAQQEEV